jgi:hypothetical protein
MARPKRLKPPLSRFELLDVLRAQIQDAGSQSAWARRAKVSKAYVSDVLKGRRDPGPSILRALGYFKQEAHSVGYFPDALSGASSDGRERET